MKRQGLLRISQGSKELEEERIRRRQQEERQEEKQTWRHQEEHQEEERQRRQQEKYQETEQRQQETQQKGPRREREGAKERERRGEKENEGEKENQEATRDETGREELALFLKMIQSEVPMKNEEGDTTAASVREANLRIDKLSAGVQALEEVDGKITTNRSPSSETEGEIWNWKWHNGSWWFRAGPRVNSRQRRSIARMVQRVKNVRLAGQERKVYVSGRHGGR